MRTCTACLSSKPLDEFYYRNGKPIARCKVCIRIETGQYQRRTRARASALQRRWNLEHKYGITTEVFQQLMTRQGGRCAICGASPPTGQFKHLVVDHDHLTGRLRGLLCINCNRGLGFLGDTTVGISRALHYMERWQ